MNRHGPQANAVTGDNSSLARIARIRNAKLEIHWPTKVLRVTADKNTAEYTANDVEEAISKAHTTSLDLKCWFAQLDKAQFPPDNNLAGSLPSDYVSSLTGAHIVASDHYTVCLIKSSSVRFSPL